MKSNQISSYFREGESYESMSEDRLQQICFMWWNHNYPNHRKMLFAVPNGGERDALQAKILKMTGVVSGVSDLILLWNGRAYLLELKKPSGGVQSKNQKEFERQAKENNFYYTIIKSLERFIEVVECITKNG